MMKVWSICSVMSCSVISFLACNMQEDEGAEAKFAVRAKAPSYYYYHAKYLFTHKGYEDVEVAVRIKISLGSPSEMEVKDLTPPANTPVETVTLSALGSYFVGKSSGATGGEYGILLDGGACCGGIYFTPTAAPDTTFWGSKSKDLTEAEWEELQHQKHIDIGVMVHFHAKYVFTHADYDNVEVAVRITQISDITQIAGRLSTIEVKDLTPPANTSVETVTLSASASGAGFVGTSSGDTGGSYRVQLNHLNACCGVIYFWPASLDNKVYLTGTKSEDLTAAQWAKLSGSPEENTPAETKTPAAGGQQQGEGFEIKLPEETGFKF